MTTAISPMPTCRQFALTKRTSTMYGLKCRCYRVCTERHLAAWSSINQWQMLCFQSARMQTLYLNFRKRMETSLQLASHTGFRVLWLVTPRQLIPRNSLWKVSRSCLRWLRSRSWTRRRQKKCFLNLPWKEPLHERLLSKKIYCRWVT